MIKPIRRHLASAGLWKWLAAGCALMWFLIFLSVVPTGDDLAYHSAIGYPESYSTSWIDYPRWTAFHWLHINGRWPNLVMPPATNIPAWGGAILAGLGIFGFLFFTVKAALPSHLRNSWLPVLLIAIIILAFPWWDSMVLLDCQGNYIWSSLFILWSFILLFLTPRPSFPDSQSSSSGSPLLIPNSGSPGSGSPRLILNCCICFLAGFSHESASLPLAFGIAVYALLNRNDFRSLLRQRSFRYLLLSFAIGTLLAFSSPGIWGRATAERIPDDTPLLLFLKSDIIAGILWVAILLMLLFPKGRRRLLALMRSPESALLWGTFPAVFLSIYGGIVGRSGWFAQLFAIILLFRLAASLFTKPRKGLSILLSILVLAQLGSVAYWQHELGSESRRFLNLYMQSPTGRVTMDFRPDKAAPWYTLSIPRGVPDPDDYYALQCLQRIHPTHRYPLPLSPSDRYLKTLPEDALPIEMRPTPHYTDAPYQDPTAKWWWTDSRTSEIFLIELIDGKYRLTPNPLDPGDRIFY